MRAINEVGRSSTRRGSKERSKERKILSAEAFHGRELTAERPPEPEDVYWEELQFKAPVLARSQVRGDDTSGLWWPMTSDDL